MFGLMQPYFVPYIGYFQLIHKCENFVIYDDVQYTKKGWVNRNKLRNQSVSWPLSINLVHSEPLSLISEKIIAPEFNGHKILSRIQNDYSGAEFYEENIEIVREIMLHRDENLFNFLHYSISSIIDYLEIETELLVSSKLTDTSTSRGEEKIFQIAKYLGQQDYINPISGQNLYSSENFRSRGVNLKFIEPETRGWDFSILDTLFCFGKEQTSLLATEGRIISDLVPQRSLNTIS